MLIKTKDKRITIKQILSHPWFKQGDDKDLVDLRRNSVGYMEDFRLNSIADYNSPALAIRTLGN
jgi:serine/threonine protein kinase